MPPWPARRTERSSGTCKHYVSVSLFLPTSEGWRALTCSFRDETGIVSGISLYKQYGPRCNPSDMKSEVNTGTVENVMPNLLFRCKP